MLVLDDWQKEVLEYEGDFLLCTGRRVGKTTIMAIKAAERMIKQRGCEIIVCSLTEDQALLIIQMALTYLKENYKPYFKGAKTATQREIFLNNKSHMLARPVGNTGDAIRGFNGHVLVLDELSRFNELILTASTPILMTTGGEIWGCSTPFGKQGYFWKRYKEAVIDKDPDARFKVFHYSSVDVIQNRPISESWTETQRAKAIRHLEKEQETMSRLEFGQEYLGQFMEDLMQYFGWDWINRVCTFTPTQDDHHIIPEFDYYLGVDIARMGDDESSFEVLERRRENGFRQVYHEITRKTKTTDTEDKIVWLDSLFNFNKIYIDAGAGSLGVGVFDHLFKRIGKKVIAVNNREMIYDRDGKTQKFLKEDLYDNLRTMGERGYIQLLNNEKVRNSLASVQYEYVVTKSGKVQIRIFGADTHVAEGLIRAAVAGKEKVLNMRIHWV